jgi:hypothetical protein
MPCHAQQLQQFAPSLSPLLDIRVLEEGHCVVVGNMARQFVCLTCIMASRTVV